MKSLACLMAVLFSVSALAYEVPRDAVIKVFDGKGRQIGTMSRSKYKVVLIEEHPAVAVAPTGQPSPQPSAEPTSKPSGLVYSAILSGGVGKDGLDYAHNGADHVVNEHTAPVGMAQLCATKNQLGLCAHATTNQFYGLGVKFDFH